MKGAAAKNLGPGSGPRGSGRKATAENPSDMSRGGKTGSDSSPTGHSSGKQGAKDSPTGHSSSGNSRNTSRSY